MTAPTPPERGRYGPRRSRPGLSADVVAAAGRVVVERDGLEALTMRAVASQLATAPMSLYRHVADRDALLVAMLEQAAADGVTVEVAGRTPRARLRRRFVALHDYLAEHMWVVHVLVDGALVAENALPWTDACLADLMAGGLPVRAADEAFRVCWQYTLGELLDTHPLGPLAHPTQREQAMQGVDPLRMPALAAVRDARGPMSGDQHGYARGIDLLLVALLAGRRR